ncbi:carboxypeptidase-like regulatory domain-containing protein [Mesohalobacter halotolerans]|uniref:Carboxypeptidase-like regulatory domain-containing protein n=1 Tax=Mesohalobacter halotolerans TaxID=1883405 RepID=A0A4U5TTJ7_9FLAO|nr:carboxypeptidase-like regulatory domain-containing protein [Mesohalobacter halotolerans]TKS57546.1 hypothetical protein FCN74_03780 [Mesohalobacter halotolerans]
MMKTVFLSLLILTFSQSTLAQQLTSKVVDENKKPLVGATVYFDGTTRGVITNLDGIFRIKKPENLSEPILVISYLGYETLYENNLNNLKNTYQLKPNPENLDTVDLYASPFSREDMLEVFEDNFLGKGRPARQCKILNLDDVIVYYVVKENTLYAKSMNPIIIKNNYLGYKIKFDLKDFQVKYSTKTLNEYYLKQSYYAGFSFFEDINPKKSRRRQKIYESSLNKFFKSLIEDNLDNTKFVLGYKGFAVRPEEIFGIKPLENDLSLIYLKSRVIKTFNSKYIPSKITLKHKRELSTLQFQKGHCRVDQFGNNLDIQNVLLIGDLSESKVAKMLPLNFSLEKLK